VAPWLVFADLEGLGERLGVEHHLNLLIGLRGGDLGLATVATELHIDSADGDLPVGIKARERSRVRKGQKTVCPAAAYVKTS
jgi:hypothetical protein